MCLNFKLVPCAHWGEVQINVHLWLYCILYTLPFPSKWPADKWRLSLMHETMPFLLPHLCSSALCAKLDHAVKAFVTWILLTTVSCFSPAHSLSSVSTFHTTILFWTSSDENKPEKQDLSIYLLAMTWNLIQVNKKYWCCRSHFERWSLRSLQNRTHMLKYLTESMKSRIPPIYI